MGLWTLVLTSSLLGFAAPDKECPQILKTEGNTCSDLKVSVDLSRCTDTNPVRDAVINCGSNGNAFARIWTPDAVFRLELQKKDESWKLVRTKLTPRNAQKPASAKNHEADVWGSTTETPHSKVEVAPAPRKAKAPAPKPASAVIAAPAVEEREPAKAKEAQTTAAPAVNPVPAPAPAPAAPENSTKLNAFLDIYYSWNFNRPSQVPPNSDASILNTYPSATNKYRYYDFYHNQLSLSLAELTITHTQGDVTALVDLDFGTFADANAAGGYAAGGATVSTVDEVSKNIGQAYLTYKPKKVPRLVLTAGKMATHLGLEVMKSKDNWNYSRSFLFSYGLPLWHVGASAGYSWLGETLTTTLYVYNGWNNYWDNNEAKTLGAQIRWAPNDRFNVTYNNIYGPEKYLQEKELKQVHEVNSNWQITPTIGVQADFLWGAEQSVVVVTGQGPKTGNWWGYSAAVKCKPYSWYYSAFRFEMFEDSVGYIFSTDPNPDKQVLHSFTLTNSFILDDGFETRVELRDDEANRPRKFANGATGDNSQFTALAALLYTF